MQVFFSIEILANIESFSAIKMLIKSAWKAILPMNQVMDIQDYYNFTFLMFYLFTSVFGTFLLFESSSEAYYHVMQLIWECLWHLEFIWRSSHLFIPIFFFSLFFFYLPTHHGLGIQLTISYVGITQAITWQPTLLFGILLHNVREYL